MEAAFHSSIELAKYELLKLVFDYIKEPSDEAKRSVARFLDRYQDAAMLDQMASLKEITPMLPFPRDVSIPNCGHATEE